MGHVPEVVDRVVNEIASEGMTVKAAPSLRKPVRSHCPPSTASKPAASASAAAARSEETVTGCVPEIASWLVTRPFGIR